MWRSRAIKAGGDLAERMFRYFYRIWDRYNVPITAIAILTDESKGYRLVVYSQELMGTSLRYDFNSYKILDQEESELRSNRNPFSVIVLTALLAIKNKKISDEGLKAIKHDLYDEMINREMDKDTRQGLYDYH